MVNFKNLVVILCLMTTSASASVIVKGIDVLSPQDQEKVFSVLINPKHDLERVEAIEADLAITLPHKNLKAYWVPDTLYQVTQSYFDVQGIGDNHQIYAKQTQGINPKDWKQEKKKGAFKNREYPTNLQEHKALSPTVVTDWARFNTVADNQLTLAHFQTRGSQDVLSKFFEIGPQYQRTNEKRNTYYNITTRTSYLKANEAFLKHALTVEEQAHQDGKLLFWRYTQPLAGDIPDLPFKIHADGLDKTLHSPLEFHKKTFGPRFSYASRLLDGFFGDGTIHEMPFSIVAQSACTFSEIANDNALKRKGYKIPNSIVHSLALSPEKIKDFNDKFFLYYPREAVPQHMGIYGTREGFHPSWLFDYQPKDNVKAWLELMQSDALQIHSIKGTLQADFKNNPEAQRLRATYRAFLNKAETEPISLPKEDPIEPPKPQPPAPWFAPPAPKPAPKVTPPAPKPSFQHPPVAPKKQAPATQVKKKSIAPVKKASNVKVKKKSTARVKKTSKVQVKKKSAIRVKKSSRVRVKKKSTVRIKKPSKVRVKKKSTVRIKKPSKVRVKKKAAVRRKR